MKHSSTPFFRFIILFLTILFIWPTLTAGVNIPEDFLKPHILEVGLLDDCDTEDYTAANFSGMDEDAYSFINERAKLLRNVIPDGQRCDFRIFDCATYPVLAMSEGDEANQRGFELLIDQIEQQIGAKYYLTIVRVLHPTSEGSTLMVKLKLPKGDAFPDDDAAQIALETYLKSFIKTELPVSPLPSRLVEFETMLLDSTAAAIDRLLSGVPMLSSSQNRARMEEDGFVFFDLPGFTVLPGVTGADGEQIIENKRSSSNGVFLIDNFSFEGLDGSNIDLHSSFQNQLTEIDNHYYKPRNEFFNGNVIVSNNVGGYSNDRYNTEYQSYLSGEHDFKMWVDIYEHNADTVKMAVLYDQSDSLSSYIYQDHFNAITDQTDEIICNSNIGFSGIDFRVKNCLYDDPISTAAETAYQLLIQTNGEFPVGLISGFVDGLIEMLDFVLVAFAQSSSLGKDLFNKSIVGISFNFIRNLAITKNFRESAIQSHMTAHKAQQALVKRAKIVFNVLGGLISNFGSVFTAIKNSIIEWLGNLAFKNGIYQAGYTYGKTLFELVLEVGLGIFTGGTANLARNGGKILNRMSKLIENGPEGLASYIGEVAKNKLTHLDINPFSGNNLKRARNLIFGCFVAGTMISTADGGVPIEQIQVGDSVLCYDFVKAQVIEEKVLGKVSLEVQGLIQIKLGDNHVIEATPEHPFMTESGWLEARMLDENNLLLGKQGDWISISSIKKNSTELRRVYNFEVQHCHNYYVGEGAVLVHNVNGLVCTITTIATSWVQIPVVIADNLIRMVSGSISKAAFKKKVDDLLKAESGYVEHSFTDPRDGKTMYFIKKQAAEYDQSKRVFVIGKIDPTSPNGLQGNKLVWGEIDNHVFDEMSNLAPEELFELIDDMRRTDGTALDIGKLSKGVVRAWRGVVNHADLRKNVNFLENIADYSDDLLLKLDVDLLNPNYTLKELFLESPADVKNIWKKLKDDPAFHWEILDDGSGFVAGSRWDKWSKREFFKFVTKKGKDFENVVTTIAKNGSGPPFNGWLNNGYIHHGQLHIENLVGGKRIIGDDVFIKTDIDDLGVSFKRAIYHDSKLSSGSPWTPNQKSELIDIFSGNPNKQYIEFEVRTANSNLPSGGPVSQGDKVRIYREDVFKSISDGNGALGSTNAVF